MSTVPAPEPSPTPTPTDTRSAPAEVVFAASGLHKSYGGIHALQGASIEIRRGEVHGLLGENGSGKSTLLKIVSGQVQPTKGHLALDGLRVAFPDTHSALTAGIVTINQETSLVPDLSVTENVLLGRRLVRRRGGVDWKATHRRAREILERLQLDLDPHRQVWRLRPDQQQMVEIARAVSMDARILILDEPTSSLTDDEVEAVLRVVRQLSEEDVATIFVSHRMKEVFSLVHSVTVLRDGKSVGAGAVEEFDERRLVELMVGKELETPTASEKRHELRGRSVLRLRGMSVAGRLEGVDLDVAAGEIVGLAGLVGAGRSELLSAAFGVEPHATGTVEVDGVAIEQTGPVEAMRRGLAYVPSDRKLLGLVLGMGVKENLVLARNASIARWRTVRSRAEAEQAGALISELGVTATDPSAPVATLSGGNQQKVLFGKWLSTRPKVLLLDEPTRGVDVGAKAEIYRLLTRSREAGLSILISSSETSELLLLCDRVLVMFQGRIVASLAEDAATEARITHLATGGD